MIGIAALFLAQAAAPQGLVYLKCDIVQNNKTIPWEITLNESTGQVDYDNPRSGPQRRPARFTGDNVFFIGFTLSRVDLSITRQMTDFTGAPLAPERGTCRIATPAARAF